MTPQCILRVCTLARLGFSGRFIQASCRQYEGEEYSVGYIYSVVRSNGLTLKAYRDGETQEAQDQVRREFPGQQSRRVWRHLGDPPRKTKEKP